MEHNSYLAESELVILMLVLTFVGTILYAKRASKKRRKENDQ
ncbi:amino acid ABC transporter permease [Brevibacillus sp. SYP-B805]|nr:amino acid ABC transporter permease [Brevibacillus sp. SYP-B805]NGQ96950.1 amino acid ABC transporter permease [Brevibacillus sp. SYP-B805]